MIQEKRREHNSKYYEKHKDILKDRARNYYKENREEILRKKKEYNIDNYYDKCSCGRFKWITSKRCSKCHHNQKGKGSVTRTTKWKKTKNAVFIAAEN